MGFPATKPVVTAIGTIVKRLASKLGLGFAAIWHALAVAVQERRPRTLASPPVTCWLDRAFPVTTPTKEQPVNFRSG